MMRKAQDRAGLHGDLGGLHLQGMEGMAGFGSTLASNKFVRAAIREEVRYVERSEVCWTITVTITITST